MSLGRSWVSQRHFICVIDERIGYIRRHERIAGVAVLGGPRAVTQTAGLRLGRC